MFLAVSGPESCTNHISAGCQAGMSEHFVLEPQNQNGRPGLWGGNTLNLIIGAETSK